MIQRLRKEAEEARQTALAAQADAQRTKEVLEQRLKDLQRQAEDDARLAEARTRIQPGDRVVVPRFGYDRPGRVVKLDPRKNTASIAIGSMKWDVPLSELIPQVIRTPEVSTQSGKPAISPSKPPPRLEDFEEEP
jgi:DNA mismatch repair protein MutS2